MRPKEVDDRELQQGIRSLKYIPPLTLPMREDFRAIAAAMFYGTFPADAEFTARLTFDRNTAERHIKAIIATKITPTERIDAIARALTLWYTTISVEGGE